MRPRLVATPFLLLLACGASRAPRALSASPPLLSLDASGAHPDAAPDAAPDAPEDAAPPPPPALREGAPSRVELPSRAARLVAGGAWACALDDAGSVRCWGRPERSEEPAVGPLLVPGFEGSRDAVLTPLGTRLCASDVARTRCLELTPWFARRELRVEEVVPLAGATTLTAPSEGQLCGLLGGSLRCAQLSSGTAGARLLSLSRRGTPRSLRALVGFSDGRSVAAAESTLRCMLAADGVVGCDLGALAWRVEGEQGIPLFERFTAVPELRGATELRAGPAVLCGLVGDELRCAGELGPEERTPPPLRVPAVRSFSVANTYLCAARASGEVCCYGHCDLGHCGDGDPAPGARGGREGSACVGDLTDALEVAVSTEQACARRVDGSVWCWASPALRGSPARAPEPPPALRLGDLEVRPSAGNIARHVHGGAAARVGHLELTVVAPSGGAPRPLRVLSVAWLRGACREVGYSSQQPLGPAHVTLDDARASQPATEALALAPGATHRLLVSFPAVEAYQACDRFAARVTLSAGEATGSLLVPYTVEREEPLREP